jgi:hypothetical protein
MASLVVTANHCYSYHQGFVKQAGTPVESLTRSLFQVMLHFCRAPFRGAFAAASWRQKRSETRFRGGEPNNV